jgi:hypothetical protein
MDIAGGDVTHLGFGGVVIDRLLERGDEFYLLVKCEVSSTGERDGKKDGDTVYSAGCRTTLLRELDVAQATKLAVG